MTALAPQSSELLPEPAILHKISLLDPSAPERIFNRAEELMDHSLVLMETRANKRNIRVLLSSLLRLEFKASSEYNLSDPSQDIQNIKDNFKETGDSLRAAIHEYLAQHDLNPELSEEEKRSLELPEDSLLHDLISFKKRDTSTPPLFVSGRGLIF